MPAVLLLLGLGLLLFASGNKSGTAPTAKPSPPPLPSDPRAIVKVPGHGGKDVPMLAIVAYWFKQLQYAAAQAGFNLMPTSGYRTLAEQTALWKEGLAKHKTEAETRKYVAKPGNSEHEKGSAIDLYLDLPGVSENADRIRQTPIYHWLEANANRYGFRWYNRQIEPWHIEYYYLTRDIA